MGDLTDTKTEKVAQLIEGFHGKPISNLLVVGCGAGLEAAILAQRLGAKVTGIDLEDRFDERAKLVVELKTGDATALEFGDGTFDFIFSYHALEHISDPNKALQEMHRVMTPDAGFWIGTPNKARVVGYIGGKDTSLREKVRWNIMDWEARFAGQFENELGAHAGYTSEELRALLSSAFSVVDERTTDYFSSIYSHRIGLIKAIEASRMSHRIYQASISAAADNRSKDHERYKTFYSTSSGHQPQRS
jgi:ubiquinone/menaquinone biosynthesis C-methylase UbiE